MSGGIDIGAEMARRTGLIAWAAALALLLPCARGGAVELPFPPMPPVAAESPPPADPWPSLYRGGAGGQAWLLTLVAERKPPTLKSGREPTLAPRPNDVVQAKGDEAPIEGKIRKEQDGKIWFYSLKGIGHPKNPLVIADLLVFKRQAQTIEDACRERSKEAGEDADAHQALAQECIDAGLLPQAEAELRRAAELDPAQGAAWLRLADLQASQGKLDAEIGVYQGALAAGADSPEIRERLGDRCFELGLLGQAWEHFSTGFAAAAGASVAHVVGGQKPMPEGPLARLLMRRAAEVRIAQGRLDEAARILDCLARAAPDDPAVENARALADLLAGRAAQAIETLRRVTKAPGAPASAFNNLAAALLNTGTADGVLGLLDACRTRAPSHAKAAVNTVLALAAAGRPDEARKALAALPAASAASIGCQLAAGYLAERESKPDEALAAYRAARAIDRASFDALCGLGRAALAKGDPAAAGAAFDQARLLRPDDPQALRGAGTSLYLAGKFAEAVDVFRGLAAAADPPARDLARLGIASLRLPEASGGAAGILDRALRAGPDEDPYALAGRAYLAAAGAAGTLEEARAALRRAQAAADAPEVSRYAAEALRLIAQARREEFTPLAFAGEDGAALPEGWTAEGRGAPAVVLRGKALVFEGRSDEASLRQVVRTEAVGAPSEPGFVRRFARFEASTRVPVASQATVGILLGTAEGQLQVGLRTQLQPKPSRHLAYRIVQGGQAGAWVELPGSVALEDLRLGLALGDAGEHSFEVLLDGRPVGKPIEAPGLRRPAEQVQIGFFAALEPGQECLFTVRDAEIVWKREEAPK